MHEKIKDNDVDVKLMAAAAQDGGRLGDAPFEGSTWPSEGLNVDEVDQCNQAKIEKRQRRSECSWVGRIKIIHPTCSRPNQNHHLRSPMGIQQQSNKSKSFGYPQTK